MEPRTIQRRIALDRASLSEQDLAEKGQFRVTLATDSPVDGPLGPVVLSHAPGAASLPGSLPLVISHDLTQLPVGKITRLGQKGGTTTGTVTLSRNVRATLAPDIADGIITDLSISALIRDFEIDDTDTLIATKWEAIEGSLVARGADPGAKIHRALNMSTTETSTPKPHPERNAQIASLFTGLEGENWLKLERDALHSTDPIATIREQVIAELKAAASRPVDSGAGADRPQPGQDALDKYRAGLTRALDLRCNLVAAEDRRELEREVRAGPFLGLSLLDCAREYLRAVNVDTSGMNRDQVARAALFTSRAGIVGHAPGDFTDLLAATVNKSLAKGYDEAPETWQSWTGRDSSPDFKQNSRPVMSAFSDLAQIHADGEYTYGTFSDKAEVFTIERWGKLFSIGRTAIVNDDLSAFSRIPRAMGRAAARKVGDEVYAVLTTGHSGYTMNEDATALFHANHSNYVASGSGGAISVATLNTARASMATQTEPGGHTIRITPRYLISSEGSAATAETIIAAAFNPSTASGVDPMPGYIGRLTPVSDPRLDADTATKWYLAGDPGTHDTVLVAFLDGITEPMLEEFDAGPSRDGVVYKVRHEFVAYAGDYRALYLNWGA